MTASPSPPATGTQRPLVVAIMGSYREHGTIHQLTLAVLDAAAAAGADTECYALKDLQIAFCTNCRECMQPPGPARGQCIHDDDMERILCRLEAAQGIVLAAPVNMWNINALSRRFMERCAGYAYWPWGQPAPQLRQLRADKKSVLISSSAAPAFIGHWLTGAHSALKSLAKILGSRPVGTLWQGQVNTRQTALSADTLAKAQRLGRKLAAGEGREPTTGPSEPSHQTG